jgi:hypothetical protein
MKHVTPDRVRHSWTQTLDAPPATVFPLLCPVRECEWVPGWDPVEVHSVSGVAEEGCIFVTRKDGSDSTWVVTRFDPPRAIQFVKHTPGETMGVITIELSDGAEGRTRAEVAYAYTALGFQGARAVADFTRDHYRTFMMEWEAALNHFLATGRKIGTGSSDAR